MEKRYIIAAAEPSSCTLKLDGRSAAVVTIPEGADGKLCFDTGKQLDWYIADISESSSFPVHLPSGTSSDIVWSADGVCEVILFDGCRLDLNVQDPACSGKYEMPLKGLVSDGQLIDFAGALAVAASTGTAELNFPVNLKTGAATKISAATTEIDLRVLRQLSGRQVLRLSLSGPITVYRALDGGEAVVVADTSAAQISAAVLTVLSDWTEQTLTQMSEKTLDELIYKEV